MPQDSLLRHGPYLACTPTVRLVYYSGMTDAIGYVRVSTEEQADSGAGLEAQRAAILAEAERRGWHLVEIIEDAGFSGKDLKRPGIVVALDALKRRKADTLVVSKLDRLSRSMLDFAALMDRASREHWALVALDLGVDTTTPSGEMMANVLATFAQFERRLIGQRTRDALAVKRANGVRLGRPPTMPQAVVDRIVAARAAGQTLDAIAAELNRDGIATARGGQRWYKSTVAKVLHGQDRSLPSPPAPASDEPG
jgi:DNA invertase Pin-like site-specific DNA recombinase